MSYAGALSQQRGYMPVHTTSSSPSGSSSSLLQVPRPPGLPGSGTYPPSQRINAGPQASPVRAAFSRPPSDASQALSSADSGPRGDVYDTAGRSTSLSSKFLLSPDPSLWGSVSGKNEPEPDDYLHDPDPRRDKGIDSAGTIFSSRGLANIGCLAIVFTCLIGLFLGYPVAEWAVSEFGSSSVSGALSDATEVTSISNFPSLIDTDTPEWAKTRTSFTDGETEYTLVFSDEFNTDGRTFYPGDDPYWEAVDLHYWQTTDLEWYDPAAVTTVNGSLQLTLSEKSTHDLDYQGGMVQTWNKFCFTGGIVEASVQLPGSHTVQGLWPAVWTMGNLGRAGYGASLDGMWPYTYDTCDVGTVANQTKDGLPTAATINGDDSYGGVLSYLPGQRLSRCTCSGESHPGPVHDDGTYVGRSAPEIDMFEAQITDGVGQVSQSGQFGPFNYEYQWNDTAGNYNIPNTTATSFNGYLGSVYQQAVSGVTDVDQDCYQLEAGCYSVYAVEYEPGFDDAYITWVARNTSAWTLYVEGVGSDDTVEIGPRSIPQEPMYILANLGISTSFTTIDYDNLIFPAIMLIDYIRVYQRSDSINIGCDPSDFPTAAYISTYAEAYSNPNYTTWAEYGQSMPKNSFLDEC